MEVEEIRQAFQDAIDEAVRAAGARPDDYGKNEFARMARQAAMNVRFYARDDDEALEGMVKEGRAVFGRLVADMAAFAKKFGLFPEIGQAAIGGVMIQKGPNPPYWD